MLPCPSWPRSAAPQCENMVCVGAPPALPGECSVVFVLLYEVSVFIDIVTVVIRACICVYDRGCVCAIVLVVAKAVGVVAAAAIYVYVVVVV